jgi:hypothetical protein
MMHFHLEIPSIEGGKFSLSAFTGKHSYGKNCDLGPHFSRRSHSTHCKVCTVNRPRIPTGSPTAISLEKKKTTQH